MYVGLLRIPEIIFILIISLTMLSVDGKLFWVLNLFGAFLKIGLGGVYCMANANEFGISTLLAMDIVLSFMFFAETIFQALDTFYNPSGAGKIIANLTALVFLLAYCFLLWKYLELSD